MTETPTLEGVRTIVRRSLSQGFWTLWKSIPLSAKARAGLLNWVFRRLPFLVFWSASYRNWAAAKDRFAAQLASIEQERRNPQRATEHPYVELSALPRPSQLAARALAFYVLRTSTVQKYSLVSRNRPAEFINDTLIDRPEIRRQHAALAHQYGLEAFCFYVSNPRGGNDGERALAAFADDAEISFSFCICWDNAPSDPQQIECNDELATVPAPSSNDDAAFISHFAAYLHSAKYLHINGRPFVMVRRPDLLPDPNATAARLRDWCRNNRIGEIYLAYPITFAGGAPEDIGFDSVFEVSPGVKPDTYEQWLQNAVVDVAARAKNPDERLVAIHAWNDWQEAAHLEPDLHHGYAWLAATRRALSAEPSQLIEPADLVPAEPMPIRQSIRKILLVIHDLNRHGAQMHTLHLAATFRERFGCEVTTIACAEGPLAPDFEVHGPLIFLLRDVSSAQDAARVAGQLYAEGYCSAIVNSSASGWLAPYLSDAGIKCIGLVHEMPDIIRRMNLEADLAAFEANARKTVFASALVRDRTEKEALGRQWSSATILPQGHYKAESLLSPDEKTAAAESLRTRMNLPAGTTFIIGAGFGDFRKGVDIFCRWAVESARRNPLWHFIWIGDVGFEELAACDAILASAKDVAGNVHFAGFQKDTSEYYCAASAYALSSREDPFPTTVLEALACGTPAFFVDGTTGLADIADGTCIISLPDAAPLTFADALSDLLSASGRWRAASDAGIELVQRDFGFCSFAGDLLRLAGEHVPRISVIVPNYNYAHFLPQRIATILNQELPVWEIIFLDDASTDDSLLIAAQMLKDCAIRYRIVPNTENTGSVFAQWKKGADLARGDIVWIAEADDWASARFTQVAAAAFIDTDVAVSYTQSNQVNQDNEILCSHYLDYVADIDRERWRRPFVNDGRDELNDGLAVKNTLPNVSGVLFRREALVETLAAHMDEISTYRVAGDWCVYVHLASLGKFAFDPRPLNYHRRHAASVTISQFTEAELDEIARIQARVQELAEVSETMTAKAAAYLDFLRRHLTA
jgi:glycosyltransferase involved in cell wall biosynthesis